MSKRIADIAARQMTGIASVERPAPFPTVAPTPESVERIRRYTAELPDALHVQFKHFVVDQRTTAGQVNRALVTLLVSDPEIAQRVRELLHARP
ncbi:MAG: hypothetical protein JF885_03565 [Candidatus Dormibacteraeota bacterium]|nr:hypothetical protein [Candidatus Dormibacteraeota bacterium]MBJ7610877.1 hypothetical protein [Candidatus Dormibacteraeota bacterium]